MPLPICYYSKVLAFARGRFCQAKELQRETTNSKLKSLLLQSQKFCQMFFKFEYSCVFIFVDRNPATVAFDCDFFAFSTSDKGRKILYTDSILPTEKKINRLPTWTAIINICFQKEEIRRAFCIFFVAYEVTTLKVIYRISRHLLTFWPEERAIIFAEQFPVLEPTTPPAVIFQPRCLFIRSSHEWNHESDSECFPKRRRSRNRTPP